MIKFETSDGTIAFVNPSHITAVYCFKVSGNQWAVVVDEQRWPVTEQVAQQVIKQLEQHLSR